MKTDAEIIQAFAELAAKTNDKKMKRLALDIRQDLIKLSKWKKRELKRIKGGSEK